MVLIIVRLQLTIEVRDDNLPRLPTRPRRGHAHPSLIGSWIVRMAFSQCSIMEESVLHLVLRSESVKCKTQLPNA